MKNTETKQWITRINQGRMVTKMRVLVTKTIRDNCITKSAWNKTLLFPLLTKREHDSDWLNANNLTDCKH